VLPFDFSLASLSSLRLFLSLSSFFFKPGLLFSFFRCALPSPSLYAIGEGRNYSSLFLLPCFNLEFSLCAEEVLHIVCVFVSITVKKCERTRGNRASFNDSLYSEIETFSLCRVKRSLAAAPYVDEGIPPIMYDGFLLSFYSTPEFASPSSPCPSCR